MSELELDELDHRILEVISKNKQRTAEEIYLEITGFRYGKGGRNLINLKIQKLFQLNYLIAEQTQVKDSKILIYSIRSKIKNKI